MIAPRWRKAVRDLTARRGRTALAVLAMAAGILQITAMLAKYAWLQPELTSMYERTTPSSATLSVDHVTDALVDSVRRVPGVAVVEARPVVRARVRVGDDWVPGVFYVVRDFRNQRLDTFQPDRGAWPPARDEILLERTALRVAQVDVGGRVTLRLPGRADQVARVAGTTYAAGLPPAWMEHMVPGFIAWDSPLRGADESAQLRIRVADHPLEEGYIREVADSVKALLARGGHEVGRVTVPPPGKHPHADQMAAFLYLLLSFGILTFVLSTLLVAGMVNALMAEQVREIGILKTIGGSDRQIAGLYLAQVALLAVIALLLGIPSGLAVGRAYAEFAAGVLNADISHRPFPWLVVAFVSGVGIVVPVVVALVPVLRGTRIPVREALADHAGRTPFGARAWDRWLLGLTAIPRPLALTLRTTLVQRGRLALTIGLLACGGAVFMSALNVASAWVRSVEQDFATRRFDLAAGFVEPQTIARVDAVLARVPGVVRAEYWSGANPYLIGPAGVPGEAVTVMGIPPGSPLLAPRLASGRWLDGADAQAAVVNTATLVRNPDIAVGRTVGVRLGGRTVTFPVVGVAKELVPMPAIYVPRAAVLAVTGQDPELARSVRIVTRRHDSEGQRAAAHAVEDAFARAGIEVGALQRTQDMKQGILDHLVIILSVLTMAALLVVGVGALALASTLTLSVVQRTREFGVLGAIGATPGTIARHVWIEGQLIGGLSWLFAFALAVPITAVLEAACGNIFFRVPLDFHMAPSAAAAWLGLVVVIASAASVLPARRAAGMPVREALAHV